MSDYNFLAFQYALGLLNDVEKQAIEPNEEFNQALKKWQLHLTGLNTQAPLEQQSADKIWQAVNRRIKQEVKQQAQVKKTNVIGSWLNSWRYVLSGVGGLGLLISINLFNQTANAQLGWDIDTDLAKQQVSIVTTTHKHTDKASVCTLWIKDGDKVLLIGTMPETGKKTFTINTQILNMMQTGEMIISFENKDNPAPLPSIIQYQQKWFI